jgi:hypothetical protein
MNPLGDELRRRHHRPGAPKPAYEQSYGVHTTVVAGASARQYPSPPAYEQSYRVHPVFISRLSTVACQLGLLSLMQDGSRAGLENNGPPENAASESGSLPEEATRL